MQHFRFIKAPGAEPLDRVGIMKVCDPFYFLTTEHTEFTEKIKRKNSVCSVLSVVKLLNKACTYPCLSTTLTINETNVL